MLATISGIALGFCIGAACRTFDVPLPAPQRLVGALLVLTITLGYAGADLLLQ